MKKFTKTAAGRWVSADGDEFEDADEVRDLLDEAAEGSEIALHLLDDDGAVEVDDE